MEVIIYALGADSGEGGPKARKTKRPITCKHMANRFGILVTLPRSAGRSTTFSIAGRVAVSFSTTQGPQPVAPTPVRHSRV